MDYRRLEGTTLGKYELSQRIATEAHTVATYRAYQPSLKRHVAVQVLNPDLKELRSGYVRAAEIMADLEHSHIVPVYDQDIQDELAYIVTRFMPGGPLRQRMAGTAPGLKEAVLVVRQVSSALEYVHSRNMTHGDPSPANIVFDSWGGAYVADFHVSGLLTTSKEGELIGTPDYTAPEKWRTGRATPLTDQYALACVTYHMVTGSAPFAGASSLVGTMYRHLNEPPAAPHARNGQLPPAASDVLLRALAKRPEERYPTIADFARELEKASAARPGHVFISYSREGNDYARQLSERLRGTGFDAWFGAEIDYGSTWFKKIDEAIKSCAAFVLLMTPDSQESEWVHKEILLAKRYQKPLFPLLLKGEEHSLVIDIQFADVRDGQMPDEGFHRRLRRAVFGEL